MVTIEQIVEYVMNTPHNTNRAVLKSMLESLIDSAITPVDIEEIRTSITTNATYFASSVYNKKGSNQTLTRENDQDVAENYYVCVAEDVADNAQITIGNKIIGKNDVMGLSVGNNSFVRDTYYYIEDGKCYVAFPVMALEGMVVVNSQLVYSNGNANTLTITGSKVVGQGEINEEADGIYIANIEKKNSYIDFGLQDVEVNELILSKKIRDGKLSYGFIKADEKVDDIPGIGYYPFLWASTDEAWNSQADTTVTEYTLYVPRLNAETSIKIESRKGSAIVPFDEEIIYDGGDVYGY